MSELQRHAVERAAKTIQANIIGASPFFSLGECESLLSSKRYDYAGRPVEYMEELSYERVIQAWPKKGFAGVQPITKFLSDETKAAIEFPHLLLLPVEKLPWNAQRSRVRATDDEWFKIVKHAWEIGLMKPVRSGHLITNGAGAVYKEKIKDGQKIDAQRFIPIMCPVNSVRRARKIAYPT